MDLSTGAAGWGNARVIFSKSLGLFEISMQFSLAGDKILRMTEYDLCITWCWEFDADFVRLLESACRANGLSTYQVTPANLDSVIANLETGFIKFSAYYDRTEHEKPYEPILDWAVAHNIYQVNPKEVADWAEDKATMHLELISAGMNTPYTIILPPSNEQPNLPAFDLSNLGDGFVIKPSFGGGGQGVVMAATSIEQVMARRCDFPHLKYLLQKTITPKQLDGRPAWFRVIFCDGQTHPCWWDPKTHIYTIVSGEDELCYGLDVLREMTKRIAVVCRLVFFSTEIAFSSEQQWVVIDYVNDQIDMRLQSNAQDGVPDGIVNQVSSSLALMIKGKCK